MVPDTAPEFIEENRPWLKGFNAYYDREIAALVGDVASARDAAAVETRKRIFIAVFIGATVLGFVFLLAPLDWMIFAAFGVAGLGYAYIRQPGAKYNDLYKARVVSKLCHFFELDYRARPGRFPSTRFRAMDMIPRYHRASQEDALSGDHQGVQLSFIEVHLEQQRRSKNTTQYITVFRGPLWTLEFPKPFKGITIVRTDRSAIGNFFSRATSKGERVRLEDPVFESHFEVYSDDQVEARYLLTPDFMTRMLTLRQIMGPAIQAAFHENQMLIAVNHGKNRFEAGGLYDSTTVEQNLRRTITELVAIFDLIEALNLTSTTRAS